MCSFFCPQRPDPQLETNIPDAAIGWSSFWKIWTSLFGTFLHNSRHMCVSVVDAIQSENVLHVYCWVQTFFDDRLRPGRNGFSSLTKKKRTKEINKGSMVNNWTYRFFFVCVSIFSSYHLAIISISSFQSLRLWYEIYTAMTLSQDLDLVHHSFYHDKCVCVSRFYQYDHPILHFHHSYLFMVRFD